MLWYALDKKARRRIASHLTLLELQEINTCLLKLKTADPSHRKAIARYTVRCTAPTANWLLALWAGALTGMWALMLGLHLWLYPSMGLHLRTAVFTPLFFGAISPLVLGLLPGFRLRSLWDLKSDTETLAIAAGTLFGLVWCLALIDMAEAFSIFQPKGYSLFVFALGAASAPVVEEVLFRELIPSMMFRSPHYAGHVISAICFSVAHVPNNINTFILYVFSGLFLSALRIRSEGLLLPVLVHVMANLATLLLL